MFKVTTDFKEIEQALKDLITKDFLLEVAKQIRKTIVYDLLQKSVNVHGVTLLPYEPKYAKVKKKLGYGGGVNLIKYGSLVRNMVYKATDKGMSVYIKDAVRNPNNDKMESWGTGNYKNWLIFTWEGLIMKRLQELLDKQVIDIFK